MNSSQTTKILIIEDDEAVSQSLAAYFEDIGFNTIIAANGKIGVKKFTQHQPDIVLTDLRMPIMGGLEVIRTIKGINPDVPIIVLSGMGVVKDAVESLRLGAWDYLEKPLHDFATLQNMVAKALENSTLKRQVAGLTEKLFSGKLRDEQIFNSITTRSPAMHKIFQYVEVIAPTAQPVLITGESGTGKELLANTIHAASGRKGKLVALNIAGLDDQMFADTLFGHARGAYTGADRLRDGLIAKASGGTLFLDEIGDLKEAAQVKLLRLLQEGEYFPLGSDSSRHSNARIVLATHRNLKEMVNSGEFRQDLYYRLFAHQITIPPLRERAEDIPLLLEQYLEEAAKELGKKKPSYPPQLIQYLQLYSFPGNVRELKAMIFDAVARHGSGILSMQFFRACIAGVSAPNLPINTQNAKIVLRCGNDESIPTLREAEDILITQAMSLASNNQGIAAEYLGINRSALNKKLIKRRDANAGSQFKISSFDS